MLSGVLQVVGLIHRPARGDETPRAHAAGGFHWQVLPAGDELFPDGPDLSAWVRDGAAIAIKTGPQRTVYRVTLPDGVVIVKRCRVNGFRAWWREVFRGSKSQLEFENALTLRRYGLQTIEPLTWGSRYRNWPCESLFVSRAETDAVPLQEYLEAHADPVRRTIATELGRLLATMHDLGVAHPDPHPGNLLVSFDAGFPRFTLIDLHAIRFGAALTWQESLDNLVLLNRWFQLRVSRTDRLAFWRAYVGHRTRLPSCPKQLANMAVEVERRTAESNARFWNGRLDRYQKSNRQFQKLRGGSVTGHAVRDLSSEFVKRLLADPDAPFRDPAFQVLKDSRSSTVIELPLPDGTTAIYKRFRVKSPTILLKNLFRSSAAMRSWTFGHNLLDRGLPTARPLVVLHRHRLGCPAEGYLLTEKVPAATDLTATVAALRPNDYRVVRGWADSLGRLVRKMHEKQVAHRDLKAPNILMSGHPAVPVLIDLVGVVPGKPVGRGDCVKNLARLNASFLNHPAVTRTDKLRFLRAYMAWGLHGSAGWKEWWHDVRRETLAKVAKNRRSGRPLA
jgi:tRNA A-37 threonylcarbamoyl transferase component Bud32